jgi:hypothetical protein
MADNVPGNLGASTAWNPQGLCRDFFAFNVPVYVLSNWQVYFLLSFDALYKNLLTRNTKLFRKQKTTYSCPSSFD